MSKYEIWTVNQLQKHIYPDGEIDKRFLPHRDGGAFKFFYPGSDFRRRDETMFVVALEGDLVVGLIKFEKNPVVKNQWWISFVSVDKKYEGKRHASGMLEVLVKWFADNGITMEGSTFTEDGSQKLKHKIRQLVLKYEVNYLEGNDYYGK